jgi:predicted nucleotidyltransferase component of viral defense system
MVEIKKLLEDELLQIVAETGFNKQLLTKDYYLTILLYLLKDVDGLVFKGGTALQKTILNYSRLSEDIDFTLTKDLIEIKKEITKIVEKSKIFSNITQDKDVDKFTRLVVSYKSDLGTGSVFIDLNQRAKVLTKTQKYKIKHFYPNLPVFEFECLTEKELIAEKVSAAIGRNKPRDHYDIYQLIKNKKEFDMKLVKKKCKFTDVDPSIQKMFNNANKLFNRWEPDVFPLLKEDVPFKEVMRTLAKHFNLSEEKEKTKKLK